ncbi:F-box/kelch-repeat protein [Hibiscus syriacus]|uniref:F-box/kelch-repeat protein n=1 Tax=Hibiscus syriacus TaxID=106335 RepID=A0A6A3AP26_HIBSY|nr:F-box/kelch-repeat protein At1g15670-like [Hibiscus syriacus]KAE8705147.1 F-box/kelch-repeat protein [Hibiscus syriacus]
MELIPGLPNDIARECLIRVPYNNFSSIASTCKDWKLEIHLPEFFRHRRAAGCSKHVMIMTQSRVNPDRNSGLKCQVMPIYRIVVFEPDVGHWCELPPVPGFSDGLPVFCQVVGVGLNLVVMGGLDPDTFDVRNEVYVYNFLSATWRRGADMPGLKRIFFGCASDSDRMVFVAGGHDGEKNALRSAMAYDVGSNTWVLLPDMERERDECKGIFHLGKFYVIGGYCTDRQGRFESSAELFDVATWQWTPVQENLLCHAMCPRTCVAAAGALYMCQRDDVVKLEGNTWKAVAELPAEVCNTVHVAAWKHNLLVIGSPSFGEPYIAYVLNLKNYTWTRMKPADQYSGHVQSSCYVEL